ncbi:pentachlorophenol monooxygenase [Alloalcanivorax xenomutans]|uniref:FAD-dependent monooxygenase n=1 Tax=Alloalcanivorax xenomutans TaxID=1094342 RepID=UPI000BDA453C|nr:FAD-dependent monooxygenase [Alloalcanivorax xenomutans]SOC18200.1 pentachlorophenol monooxygenase [Alloalcanivorax xenomutans]
MITGSRQAKVLIVGAGPTGLTLGVNLLRGGIPCRIIDRLPQRRPWSRALGLHARTLEFLDAMGVLQTLRERGRPIRAVNLHGEKGPLLHLDFAALGTPEPALLSCPQSQVEAVLEERFRSLGGELWRDAELLDCSQDGAGVRARLRVGEQVTEVEAEILVGADGAHSRVRELLGLPFEGMDYEETFLLADLDVELDLPEDQSHGFLLPGGALMAIPLPSGWRLITVLEEDAEPGPADAEQDLALLSERLAQVLEPVPELPEPIWLTRFSVHRRLVSHYRRNRIFLAGDACHIQSPMGAQGMNTGIADAVNLAWKLVLFLRGYGGGALLDSYQQERRPVAVEMLREVNLLSRTSTLRRPFLRGARDSLLKLAGQRAPAENKVMRRASQLDIHYRASPLVDAGPDADLGWRHQGPLPGDRVPDVALVSLHDGGPRHLHGLLRQPVHHLLLQLGEAPDHPTRVILHALLSRVPDEYLNELRITLILNEPPEGAAPDMAPGRAHLWHDKDGDFAEHFGNGSRLWLMRPDGHLAYRAPLSDADFLLAYLERLFRRGG